MGKQINTGDFQRSWDIIHIANRFLGSTRWLSRGSKQRVELNGPQ
jgi:hypothetical protein